MTSRFAAIHSATNTFHILKSGLTLTERTEIFVKNTIAKQNLNQVGKRRGQDD